MPFQYCPLHYSNHVCLTLPPFSLLQRAQIILATLSRKPFLDTASIYDHGIFTESNSALYLFPTHYVVKSMKSIPLPKIELVQSSIF